MSPAGDDAAAAACAAPPATDRPSAELAGRIRDAARELGFVRVGFTSADPFDRGQAALAAWTAKGFHGDMAYMTAHPGRAEPRSLLPEAKSIIVVALPYPRAAVPPPHSERRGVVAGYARGGDYHEVLRAKLHELRARLDRIAGRPVKARPCVDTAPILEHEAAARAGIGFIAVSTLTIVPGIGTYVLLGELITDLELPADTPVVSRCGSCSICRAACPTGAIVGPYVVDARRCVSYLTIEHRGPIPRELRALMGRRVFGCDDCQDVCPFNASKRQRPAAPELAPRPALAAPELEVWLGMGTGAYRRLVAGTALARVSRNQLARNAAVALGNCGNRDALPALVRAVRGHPSPVVRSHAAWALGRLGDEAARAALSETELADADPRVRSEARQALAELAQPARAVGAHADRAP